jgi:hypothetical protein
MWDTFVVSRSARVAAVTCTGMYAADHLAA